MAQSDPDLGAIADYPLSNEVWLSSLIGEVIVNPEFPVETSALGELEWIVGNGEKVTVDQVLCHTAVEKIRLSERDLALRKSQYPNALNDLEFSYIDKRKAVETSIEEIEKKLSDMNLTDTERELLGTGFEKRLQEEKRKFEKELERLRFKLDSEYFPQGFENEKASLNLDIDKAEQTHADLISNSEIRAEEEGLLTREISDVVKAETTIGTITKTGVAEALVEISDSKLRSVPPSQLSIQFQGNDGQIYRGEYLRTMEASAFQARDPVYVFVIRSMKKDGIVPESLNGSLLFRVSRILNTPGHIVPKGDLLFKFPEEINENGWVSFITKRWEGTSILYVGPKDIVVTKTNED